MDTSDEWIQQRTGIVERRWIPDEEMFNNIQRYSNTTAGSIAIALDEAIEHKLISDKSTVLFIGLGAGLTWGAVLLRFADPATLKIS